MSQISSNNFCDKLLTAKSSIYTSRIKIFASVLSVLVILLFAGNIILSKKNNKLINMEIEIDNNFLLYKDTHLNLNITYVSMLIDYSKLEESNKKLLENINRLTVKYPENKKIRKIKEILFKQHRNINLIKQANSKVINLTSSLKQNLFKMFGKCKFSLDKNATNLKYLSGDLIDILHNIKFLNSHMFRKYQKKSDEFKLLKLSDKSLIVYKKEFILHTEEIYRYAKILHANITQYHKFDKQLTTLYKQLSSDAVTKHMHIDGIITFIQIVQTILFFTLIILVLWLLKLENRYERQKEKLKMIIDKNIISSTTDADGIITDVSQACCDISGYTREELIGFSHNKVRDPKTPTKLFENLWKTIKAGKTWRGEIRNIRKNGTYFWVSSIIEPVLDNQGKITSYLSIKTNITNKMRLEELSSKQEIIIKEQTRVANEQRDKALNASKAKSEFLANMSHEIRTPLNAILGFIKLLKENEKDKTKQSYLEIIESSSGSLLEIVNDILDFSKIERKKLKIDKTDFNPSSEFNMLAKLFKTSFDEKNIIFTPIYTNLPECLCGDMLRIKQVIGNLLSNAMKFTPQNKQISLHVEYQNGLLHVSVKDEGIGISEKYIKKIFKAFSQEDSSTTRKYGGTGLGLAISYSLIKAMGGELKVESKISKGSKFSFSLPLKICKNTKTEQSKVENKFLKGKILLVEDNRANQMFMKIILKKIGLEINIADDGIQAVEAYKKERYDAILMDENMPNMSGIEATKEILTYEKQNNLKHTPIIALTANALKGDREKFLKAGMDEYLTKPVNKQKLIEVLEELGLQQIL